MKNLLLILALALASFAQALTPTVTPTITNTFSVTVSPTITVTLTPANTQTPNPTQTAHVVNYDSSTILTITAATTSWSTSYTMGTATSGALLVSIYYQPYQIPAGAFGAVYGGVRMQPIASNTSNGNVMGIVKTFYLLSPATGSNTLTLTLPSSFLETSVVIASYTNVWYIANTNAVNNWTNDAGYSSLTGFSTTLYAGFSGGTTAGIYVNGTSENGLTITGRPGMTNRSQSYGKVPFNNAFVSLDDVRNYSATSIPYNWTNILDQGVGYLNSVELVPR